MFFRFFKINPLTYSFIAGAIISLAGNIFCTALFNDQLGLVKWQIILVCIFQLAASSLFFSVSVKLEQIRIEIERLFGGYDHNHLETKLGDPKIYKPIRFQLILGIGALLASFLLLIFINIMVCSPKTGPSNREDRDLEEPLLRVMASQQPLISNAGKLSLGGFAPKPWSLTPLDAPDE